jgi:hypothetical protein
METDKKSSNVVQTLDQQTVLPTEAKKLRKWSLTDKLSNIIAKNPNEISFLSWNLSLYMWEIIRDAGHYEKGNDVWGPLAKGTPIATEGAWGFID